jgi:hypothetical protein
MEELKYKVAVETDRIEPDDLIDSETIQVLVELNGRIEDYKRQLKELEEVQKTNKGLTFEQRQAQEEIKLALKEAQNEYRQINKSIQTNDAALKANTNTYKGLVDENKALMEAMRNLPLDDTTGELQRLQTQYNKNNQELKKFDTALGNHQRNVGNYKDGLNDLGGTLSGLPGSIGKVGAGMKSLDVIMKASVWGLVISAVAALINQLSKLQPVVDFVTKQFQVLSSIVKFFVDNTASALGLIEKNNISLAETVRVTKALADAEIQLREAKRLRIVESANEQLIISELRLAAADMTKSEQERLDILRQIEEIEGESLQKKLRIAAIEFGQAKTRVLLSESTEEELENLAKLEAELKLLQVESNNFLRENTTKRTELQNRVENEEKLRSEKAAEERKKRLEEERIAIESLAEARQAVDQKMFDELGKSNEEYLDLGIELTPTLDTTDVSKGSLLVAELFNNTLKQQTIARLEEEGRFAESMEEQKQWRIQELTQMFIANGLDANQAALDAQFQANLEYQDKIKQAEQDTADFKKGLTDQDIANAQFAANAVLSIGKNIFGESKALAVAQAVIDSLGAAVSVMRDTKGPVWKRLASAAVILSAGYANVKKILSTKPGSANTSGASATASSAMSSMAVTPAGTLVNQGLAGGMFAQQVAGEFTPATSRERNITIDANVDRRGLAIAVREGERSIRTQQFDYK